MAAPCLVYADQRPVRAADIAAIRARANLAVGPTGGWNSYAYDGAIPFSPDLPQWLPSLRSGDSNVNMDWMRLAARARDLVRNDGWAKGAINRLLDAVVGATFFPIPQPNYEALQRRLGPKFDKVWAKEYTTNVRAEWKLWADSSRFFCDDTRTQTVTQMFRTALRHKLVDGDAVAMLPWQPGLLAQGADYCTTIQLIEPERLCNPQWMIDSKYRRGGVQVDERQAPVGYHIQQGHSLDWYSQIESVTWKYIPRETEFGRAVIVHDFDREMTRQHRGVGILTAALARLQKMNRYDDASLMAALLRATMGLFIISGRDEGEVQDSVNILNSDGAVDGESQFGQAWNYYAKYAANTMGGVRMPVMPPGDRIQAVQSTGNVDDYEAINQVNSRYLSAVTQQSTPAVSNDFSKLNYSSFRGEEAQAWRSTLRRRADFGHGFCTPIYGAWAEECVMTWTEMLPAGFTHDDFVRNRAGFTDVKWFGPGMGWTDPVKERQGEVLGLDACFGSLEDTCATVEGVYWRDRLAQRAIELEEMTELRLKHPDWAGEAPASAVDQRPQPA
jgi:lambda family phage portal protein